MDRILAQINVDSVEEAIVSSDETRAIDVFIERMPQLHSAPQVALKVLELTRDIDFDVRKVVDCLETDPALATRILQIVNSSRYGFARQITSLKHAVGILGQRSLRLLATTFNVVGHLTKGSAAEIFYGYWRRAMTMAVVASRLAEDHRDIDRDDAYSTGLLADVGVLAFAQSEPRKYLTLHHLCAHGDELVAAESEAFGFDHAALGERLLERWEFPEQLTTAIGGHHGGGDPGRPLLQAVVAADLLADVLWMPESPTLPRARSFFGEYFGKDTDALIELAVSAKHDIGLNAEMFGIRLDESIDCDALLAAARRQQLDASLEVAMDLDSLASTLDDHSI